MSVEITPSEILVMDGIGEGKLGMITAFCRTDQVKVEPSDALLTLVQWDSPKPSVIVVKVLTTLPHLLQGSFRSPYLDVTTLSVSTLTTQSHLPSCICAGCSLILSLRSSFHKRKRGAKKLPSPCGDTVGELRRGASFVPPLPLSVPIVSSHSNRDVSMQTKEVPSFSLTLRQL